VLEKIHQFNQALVFSTKGFFLFSIVSTISIPLTYNSLIRSNNLLHATLLGFGATLATFIAFQAVIFLNRRKPVLQSFFYKFIFLILLGLFRGLFIFYGGIQFGLQDPLPLAPRLLNSAFTTVIWLSIGSLFIETNRKYHRKYRALLSQLLISNARASKELEPSFAKVAQELAQLQGNLYKTYKKALIGNTESKYVSQAAHEIRQQIDLALRPLSHRIWSDSFYQSPKVKIVTSVWHATKYLKFPLSHLLVLFGTTSFVNYVASFGIQEGTVRTLSAGMTLGLGEVIRRSLTSNFNENSVVINLIYLVVIGFAVNLVAAVSVSDVNLSEFLSAYLVLAIFTVSQIILLSSAHLTLSDRNELLSNLNQLIKGNQRISKKNSLSSSGQANVASYLHNSLQSELTALAISLDRVAANPDSDELDRILQRLHGLAQRSMSEDFQNYIEQPEKRLQRIVGSWIGIATINLDISHEIYSDEIRCTLFIQLVEESIANSIRRGNSSNVNVHASYQAGALQVTIQDNGEFDPSAKKGFGYRWIEKFAFHDWSITPSTTGTTVRVEF